MPRVNICKYHGEPRPVNLEVCEWHFERRDPLCQKCEVYKAYERRALEGEKKDPAVAKSG